MGLIVVITTVLRLGWPGLTEFKADEARLMLLALEMAEGAAFHIRGISSSVGFPNFPMSVWVYALPLLVWKHVYAATLFTGLINTLAVLGCYWLVRRYYGVEAAIVAALMFAVSPWAIHHSRKIWAQNLIPPFIVGWGISAVLAFVEKRSKWLIPHFLCLAIAAQAHLAAMTLVPVSGLLLIIYRKRIAWKTAVFSLFLAALTVAPFIYYLATAGTQFLQGSAAGSALPSVTRPWDLSAFRFAWLLFSGQEIHALAGSAAFEDYLATVPDLTGIHILWGLFALGGIVILVWQAVSRKETAVHTDLAFIFLLWLIVPIIFFTYPGLPSELHYLLPIYPVPFIAVGVYVSWLRQKLRRIAIGLILLSAVAQVAIWGMLLGFVSKTATPGGFGVPLAMQLEATSLAEAQFASHNAREVLIAGDGQYPLAQDFPAIYDVLLHNVPHRFVDVTDTAVFPDATTIIFLDPLAGDGAALYQAAAKESDTIPLRQGEGELQVLVVEETAVSPAYPFDPPHILTNWAAFAGYDDPILHDDGTASWHIYWHTGETSNEDFHLFNHLLNANGERVAQADTAVFAATQWQSGDLVVSHARLPWSDEGVTMRSGMYSYPGLTAVQVFDIAGNPTSDAIKITLPAPISAATSVSSGQ